MRPARGEGSRANEGRAVLRRMAQHLEAAHAIDAEDERPDRVVRARRRAGDGRAKEGDR